jgi:hypothetical protein
MKHATALIAALLGLGACHQTPASEGANQSVSAGQRVPQAGKKAALQKTILLLKCDSSGSIKSRWFSDSMPDTITHKQYVEIYRIDLQSKSVDRWDDDKSRFQPVCWKGSDCSVKVSPSRISFSMSRVDKDRSSINSFSSAINFDRRSGNIDWNQRYDGYGGSLQKTYERYLDFSGQCKKEDPKDLTSMKF